MKWRKTMLECREYSYQELCSIFNTHDARSIKNRLTRWNVEYTYKGRGANLKFTIQNIHDPFRVFCILELSYSPQTDFRKLAYFLYYYMNDVEFYSLPCERQEQIMWMEGTPLTRQTIETYIQRLADNELILRASGNFRYYFALGDSLQSLLQCRCAGQRPFLPTFRLCRWQCRTPFLRSQYSSCASYKGA